MNIGKVVKWIFIGVVGSIVCFLLLVRIYAFFSPVKPPDHFHGIKPDLGRLAPDTVGTSYVQSHMLLGSTPYQAEIRTCRDSFNQGDRWDYYFVAINKQYYSETFGESEIPFFERWLRIEQLPDDIMDRKIEVIVTYDSSTRGVIFNLGTTNYICTLPPD